MTASLTATSKFTLDLTYNAGSSGIAEVSRVQAGNNGARGAIIPDVSLAFGTGAILDDNGALQVNDAYVFQGTIVGSATKSIDLIGGSDTNRFGVALAFLKIKYFFVGIIAPNGVKNMLVGPQAISNAWVGPYDADTSFETVYWRKEWHGPVAGLDVTADTADLFKVTNGTATDTDVLIVIAGKK